MSSSLGNHRRGPYRTISVGAGVALLSAGALLGPLMCGCHDGRPEWGARDTCLYPPAPQTPRVVSLGTLRGAPPPSDTEVQVALFLFGTQPPTPLALANPTGLAATDDGLLVCDATLRAVFHWDAASGEVSEPSWAGAVQAPLAIDVASNGDRLVCHDGGVLRIDGAGHAVQSYALADDSLRPGGVLAVGEQVWVTNLALHRIEIFDAASGSHLQSIGKRGSAPGEFSFPRGMALTPEGNICVVDMLNGRVQVLSPMGDFVRMIGQAGNVVGTFGRPKDIAVGPDGTVFVTDAFLQRVHVFDARGVPLMAFGEPGCGRGALSLPHGITIATSAPHTEYEPPDDLTPQYYVLVAEQLENPGVRVFGWLGADEPARHAALPSGERLEWQPHFPDSVAINPHWRADRCTTCHESQGSGLVPIRPADSDALCLSCHDGVQAPADPHPIGRPANTDLVKSPDNWPTIKGAIGCITCHDVTPHCNKAAKRPETNYVLLRDYDPRESLDYCTICHQPDAGGRFSPHRQRDPGGQVREEACFFCHTRKPEIPTDGRRQFRPHLRVESSDLCLNCHRQHWDMSPLGHVDRPVTPAIRQWMLMRELARQSDASRETLAKLARDSSRQPARLPLADNKVTCYTCHNPHYMGLFPANSELGALAHNPRDRAVALRTDWVDLCSECHNR